MNTPGTPQEFAAPPEGWEVLAEEHWPVQDSPVVQACLDTVAGHPAVFRSLAHYTHGVLDFAVRPRGSAALHTPRTVSDDPRAAEGWPGRHLVVCMEDFNRSLQRFETGELMRLLVANTDGGMYCGRVRAGQHLVGITRSGRDVEQLDNELNALVTTIRHQVHNLPNELLGGDSKLQAAEPRGGELPHLEMGLATERSHITGPLESAWRDHVNSADLQYAAYYRDWTMVCAGDAFDDPRLRARLGAIPSAERRAMYRDLADRLRADITRLRHVVRPVSDRQIERLVLDVQEGAVFIHWSSRGAFLLGVTVDQPQVALAEERLRSLLTAVSQLG